MEIHQSRQGLINKNCKSQRNSIVKDIITPYRRKRNPYNKEENQLGFKDKGMDIMLLFKEVKKPKIYLKTTDKKNNDLLTEELFKDIIEENKESHYHSNKMSPLESVSVNKKIVLTDTEKPKHQKVNTEMIHFKQLRIDEHDEKNMNKRLIINKRPKLTIITPKEDDTFNEDNISFGAERNTQKQSKTFKTDGNNNNYDDKNSFEKKEKSISHCLLRLNTKNKEINSLQNNYSITYDTKGGFDIERKAHKINQDRLITIANILKKDNFSLLTILDGHGQNGHYISELASQYIKSYFIDSMKYYIARHGSNNGKLSSIKGLSNDNEIFTKITQKNYEMIKVCMKETQCAIEECEYENDFSGCTCCNVIIVNGHIICSNIGDSRAIVVRSSKYITQLSRDHKPDLPKERRRIEENGGEIKKMNNNIGPLRVWVKGQKYPGIAMTRSLGDKIGKNIGVSCEPEITDYMIDKSDKYLIIASDGIWEHLSNEKVEEIVTPCYIKNDSNLACRLLKDAATSEFLKEKQNVDDISIIVVFFPNN